MSKNKKNQLTKLDISTNINSVLGFSNSYSQIITEDLINILKDLVKYKEVNIKNFGTFKVIFKEEREGRNPKTKKTYTISARKSLSFNVSRKLNNVLNK